MNVTEVIRIEGQCGSFRLLYSHDGGFTRHVVEVERDEYVCRINEEPCTRRGTHDKMAGLHGIRLEDMECRTFYYASIYM